MKRTTYAPTVLMAAAILAALPGCGSATKEAEAQPVGNSTLRYVIPHFLEKQGLADAAGATATWDCTLHATYVGGLAGAQPGAGATVTVHLFGDDGARLMNGGVDVCPTGCSFGINPSNRKASIRFDDLITNNGTNPFDQLVKVGFAIIVVEGDAENVNLLQFVTQAKDSPLDVAPFGSIPERLPADVA